MERAEDLPRNVAMAALFGIVLLAAAVRMIGYQWVFVGDDVVFAPADAMYHARRALYTFENFPRVLFFDAYINHPDGAEISWPPLFDFVLGALARAFTDGGWEFEAIVALSGPVFGALTCVPVYAAGTRRGGRTVGLGAALFLALLPVSATYGRVGNADHHSAVALIGGCLLLLCLALLESASSRRRLVALAVGLAVVRAALLLTWHGSLLYLVVAESTIFLAAAWSGRRELLGVQLGSALGTGIVVAPVVAAAPTPLGGQYSAIALSSLHLMAVGAVALLALGLLAAERVRPAPTPAVRLGRTVIVAVGVVGALLLLPGPRHGIAPALDFLTMSDGVGQVTGEQFPLFAVFGRDPVRPAILSWGVYAYFIPLLPVGLWWISRGERDRQPELALVGWTALFGGLALVQRRYGNDLAPAAAVGFALLLVAWGRWVASRVGGGGAVAAGAAALVGLLLFAPPMLRTYWPRARAGLAHAAGARLPGDPLRRTAAGSLYAFARSVRQATPETSGFLDPSQRPEYGIIAHANLGHALQYVGRRPTPTDPFWAYIGPRNWELNFGALEAKQEAEVVALAAELRAPYVVTSADMAPSTLVGQLHHGDGRRAKDRRRVQRMRLVTEGPRDGRSLSALFRGARETEVVPYKLFEIVEGAVLELTAAPGTEVAFSIGLRTPAGRRFVYEDRGRLGEAGIVRWRVPYSTEDATPVRSDGLYEVRLGEVTHRVRVSEEAIREGRVIPVP